MIKRNRDDMGADPIKSPDFNRRNFLRGSSAATFMTALGGVQLFAHSEAPAATDTKPAGSKVKVGVIGLGPWGREILNTLARVPEAQVAAICDTYAVCLRRAGEAAPAALKSGDYKAVLDNNEISAVIIATPTHNHKDLVLAALKAGKHVYCEAPLANTVEDARTIALAAMAAKSVVFQAGLQNRSEPLSNLLINVFRACTLGQILKARAQWHKKSSWRLTSPNPDREKEVNWRLDPAVSLGLIGEVGCHAIDRTTWFLNALPTAVTGFGSLLTWTEDGRKVPDTVHGVFEYPGGINLGFDATLGNSFEAGYEVFYGNYAALALRDGRAWVFKETDSPNFGFEVYGKKETVYGETGIVLKAGPSVELPTDQAEPDDPIKSTPLFSALQNFLKNANDFALAANTYKESYPDDPDGLGDHLVQEVKKRPAAGYREGFLATVTAIKANEAVLGAQRIILKPEWFQLS